ncbi:uncharacterized protein LOC133914806 [Phragmites australis]|uniref:uncharacterized protein LOC133914806 n=1 Tax=Phragmites australis TaxID=29695 RepID=UPI002D77CE7F|nr:uncharacterized protein LOC133914806 [Phragmites australis]
MNMTAARRKKRLFPLRLRPLQPRRLLAIAFLAVTLLFLVLVLLSVTPSSPRPRRVVVTRSSSSLPPSSCGAERLGELGDMMVSMLPKGLPFTVFVPLLYSFRRVLRLRPNCSATAEEEAAGDSDTNTHVCCCSSSKLNSTVITLDTRALENAGFREPRSSLSLTRNRQYSG